MSDLSPLCAPKRTSADHSKLMGSRPSLLESAGPIHRHGPSPHLIELQDHLGNGALKQ
jgi:hypothetical protein